MLPVRHVDDNAHRGVIGYFGGGIKRDASPLAVTDTVYLFMMESQPTATITILQYLCRFGLHLRRCLHSRGARTRQGTSCGDMIFWCCMMGGIEHDTSPLTACYRCNLAVDYEEPAAIASSRICLYCYFGLRLRRCPFLRRWQH